jgi:hypothetical protein
VEGKEWEGRTVLKIVKDQTIGIERWMYVWLGDWGHQGNGYFCSKGCGYTWALKTLGRSG